MRQQVILFDGRITVSVSPQDGFLHQKVMVVDDAIASIGTHNFDNRSFRLNFEVSAVVYDEEFTTEVAAMLERGFLVNNTSDRTIRMLPPLVVDPEDLDALVAAYREVLSSI